MKCSFKVSNMVTCGSNFSDSNSRELSSAFILYVEIEQAKYTKKNCMSLYSMCDLWPGPQTLILLVNLSIKDESQSKGTNCIIHWEKNYNIINILLLMLKSLYAVFHLPKSLLGDHLHLFTQYCSPFSPVYVVHKRTHAKSIHYCRQALPFCATLPID